MFPTSKFRISVPVLGSVSGVVLALLLSACAQIDAFDEEEETSIVVPSAATTTPQYHGDGSIPRDRYVVRMSDGRRDWEVEFPDTAQGYQMEIPLGVDGDGLRADHNALTPADRELIDHLRRSDPQYEREGIYRGDQHMLDEQSPEDDSEDDPQQGDSTGETEGTAPSESGESSEADPAPTRPSYLQGIDQVRRLYDSGHPEAALSQLSELEQAYPDDERILSMKGTLYLEIGRPSLARQAWERVLQINPDNESVREALRRLDGGNPAPDDDSEQELME